MIFLGSDHGGYELKEKIKDWLEAWGYKFEDCGAYKLDPDDDYPEFAFAVGEKVVSTCSSHRPMSTKHTSEENSLGILACRSSAGIVIAANKVKGVRAISAFDEKSARHAREHNNANVLALSGDWFTLSDGEGLKVAEAKKILKTFLETEFSKEERHKRRLEKIGEYEERKFQGIQTLNTKL